MKENSFELQIAIYNIKISSYFPIKHLFGYPGGKFWCVNTRILSGTRLSEISETALIDDHTYAMLYIVILITVNKMLHKKGNYFRYTNE